MARLHKLGQSLLYTVAPHPPTLTPHHRHATRREPRFSLVHFIGGAWLASAVFGKFREVIESTETDAHRHNFIPTSTRPKPPTSQEDKAKTRPGHYRRQTARAPGVRPVAFQ